MSAVVRLKESNCKVTDAKPHKTGSTTDASVKVVNYVVWYSVEIISTVTHLVQTVSSQGFISMVRKKMYKGVMSNNHRLYFNYKHQLDA